MLATILLASLAVPLHSSVDRHQFALLCQELGQNMTEAQVRGILGPPDEVTCANTQRDSHWTADNYWRYGVVRPGGFASYGTLYFVRGRLSYYQKPALPASNLPDEMKLRQILQAVDDGANQGNRRHSSGLSPYNPLLVVRALNALISLGPDLGLATLREYVRVMRSNFNRIDRPGIGAFAIIQTIFEIPGEGFVRAPAIGAIYPRPPKDRSDAPYWPNIVIGDLPFSAFQGAVLGGVPEPIDRYLYDLAKTYRFRAKTLEPSDEPWQVDNHVWKPENGSGEHERNMTRKHIRWQVLHLVSTAIEHDVPTRPTQPSFVNFDDVLWNKQVAQMRLVGIRWDASRQLYVRRDGSTVADISTTPIPATRFWRPDVLSSIDGYASVKRYDEDTVRVEIVWSSDISKWKGSSFDVLSASGEVLASGPDRKHARSTSSVGETITSMSESVAVRIPRGTKIVLAVNWKGRKTMSAPIDVDSPIIGSR